MSAQHPNERASDRSPIRAVSGNAWLDIVVKIVTLCIIPYLVWNFSSTADTVKNLALNSAATIALSGRVDDALKYQDGRINRVEVNLDKLNDKLEVIVQRGIH